MTAAVYLVIGGVGAVLVLGVCVLWLLDRAAEREKATPLASRKQAAWQSAQKPDAYWQERRLR